MSLSRASLLRVALLTASALPSMAAEISFNTSGTTTAEATTASNWVGGIAPGSGDIAAWKTDADPVAAGNQESRGGIITIASPVSWLGLRHEDSVGAMTLTGADITLGSSGITEVRWENLTIQNNIILGANQTWTNTTALNVSGIVSGAFGITKSGTGTLTLTGANTFDGPVTVSQGTLSIASLNSVSGGTASSNLGKPTTAANGTISLGGTSNQGTLIYTGTGETTDRIVNLSGTTGGATITQDGTGLLNFTSATTVTGSGAKGVTLSGAGSGQISGFGSSGGLTNLTKSGIGTWTLTGASSQGGGAVTINGGILAYTSAASRTSGTFVRNATGAGILKIGSGSNVITSTTNTSGILGGWATYGDTTWAVANGASAITGLSTFATDTWAAGNNTDVTIAGANPATDSTTNSLRFNETGVKTLTLAGTNTLTSGGIMVTSNVGANLTTITGGTLVGAANSDLVVHQNNSSGGLTIASIIANNTSTGLTKTGTGLLTLSGANTYTGNTTVLEGTLEVTNKGTGSANYIVGQNGTLRFGYNVGQGYTAGVTVYGAGASSTNGLYLQLGRNINFQNNGGIVLAAAPTTVRTYGTGANAIISGFDTNGTHLTVQSAASGSSFVSTINLAGGSFGYVMNIASGANTTTGDMTINGVLTGSTAYRKVGAGSLFLTGASTNTGSLDLREGSVTLTGGANRLGTGSNVILGNGTTSGKLVLDGVAQTLTNLTNVGTGTDNRVVGKGATLSTLTLNYTGAGQSFGGILGGTGTNENNLALAKTGTGTYTLTGTNTYTGGTTLTGGLLSLGSAGAIGTTGTISMNGGGLQFSASNTTDYSSRITLVDGTTSIFDTNGQNVTFANAFGLGTLGTGGFTKTGTGTLVVNSGAWKGNTAVNAGTLEVLAKTNNVNYTVGQGATLKLGYSTGGGYTNAVTVNGNGVNDAAGLYLKGGVNYQTNGGLLLQTAATTVRAYGTGNATTQGFDVNSNYFLRSTAEASGSVIDSTINVNTGTYGYKVQADLGANTATGDLAIKGVISGTGSAAVGGEVIATGLDKRGTGSLLLTAANTYSAGTSINGGAIILSGGDNRLPVATGVALGNGTASGRLVLDGMNQTVTDLLTNGTGTDNRVVGNSATTSTLTLNYTGAAHSFTGTLGGSTANENNLNFVKTGTGTFALNGTNTYTGTTTVNAGTLAVNGSIGSGDVTVGTSGTLAGGSATAGLIGGNVTIAGTLAPGSSPGTLSLAGNLMLLSTANLNWELDASAPLTLGLGTNDLVTVGGNLTLDGLLNVTGIGSFDSVTNGTRWTLMTYSGTLTNNTLDLGLLPTLSGGLSWQIDTSTAGEIGLIAIPEPAHAFIGSLGLLLILRRRR
ncbi:beta strand repeat-containing protein [Luteolibacter soli]|uniref:Autotransporter-associated beta strand repeat-containing protein n=1 Tax=Luteolibacter soli TaxID=3135280 RepID=A0ABU9AUC0_9BACT